MGRIKCEKYTSTLLCVCEDKTTSCLPNVQWLSARLQEMAVEILEVIIQDRILGQRGRDLPRPATHNKKIRKSWRLSSRTGSKASEVKICLVLSHTTTRLENREGYHPGQDPGPTRSRSAGCRVLPHTTRRLENPGGYHPGQDPGPTRSRSAVSYHTQQEDDWAAVL